MPAKTLSSLVPQSSALDSDERSVSSTFEVRASETKPQHFIRFEGRRNIVRFNESGNVTYKNIQLCKEDTKELWYNTEDYRKFEKNFTISVNEIILIEKETRHNPRSYHNTIEHVYKSCCSSSALPKNDMKRFNKWVTITVSRLGLEKSVVPSIQRDKKIRRCELLDTVLTIQADPFISSVHQRAQIIAFAAQEISQVSCRFAVSLGLAQALSI